MEAGTIIAIGLIVLALVLFYVWRPNNKPKQALERSMEVESVSEELEVTPVVKRKYIKRIKREISESGVQKEGGESL